MSASKDSPNAYGLEDQQSSAGMDSLEQAQLTKLMPTVLLGGEGQGIMKSLVTG